jgi:peptide/nickel transport system permease protein
VARIILRRLALAIPALLGVSILVFLLMQILPGDPAAAMLSPGAPPEAREMLRHQLGLDRPLPIRYLSWLGDVLTGDLGYSEQRRRSVADLLGQAWSNTFILAAITAAFGLILGSVIGTVAAIYRGSWLDRFLSTAALTGLSVPSFWLAVLLLIVFSAELNWLPPSGTGLDDGLVEFARHLVMPVIAGGLVTLGITARVTRASMIEAYDADFVTTLRAKGLRNRQVLGHVSKNALNPILTTAGLQIGYLLGGQVLIETIFSWPGMGELVFTAISQRDLVVVQGAILVMAVAFVIVNLAVDIIQALVDPSLKRATG